MSIRKADVRPLIAAIASRTRTAQQIAEDTGYSIAELKVFTAEYLHHIEEARHKMASTAEALTKELLEEEALDAALEEKELEGFWITSKTERIKRYQQVTDKLLTLVLDGSMDATTLREARSYLMYVANEMGQIPIRGAGSSDDDSSSTYQIIGVDMDKLS